MSQVPRSGLSRRDFVRAAGVAAASAALAPCRATPAPEKASPAPPKGAAPLRVGLIGCGGRGNGAIADSLQSSPNMELVAMADLFPDNLNAGRQAAADLQGNKLVDSRCFSGFDAYKRLLDLKELDLVILATPPGFRPIHFEYAVAAGKNVFMEKPVAVDPVGIRRVIAAGEKAKEKKLAVVAGTQRRHQQSYRETVRRIHAGAIGKIVAARCYWNSGELWLRARKPGMSDMEWQCRNWYYFDWLCGDHIVEQHVHNLDVINWVIGSHPVRCLGIGGRQVRIAPEFGHIYDHFTVDYEYPDGIHVTSMCRHMNHTDGNVSEHIVGSAGQSDPGGRIFSADMKEETWKFAGKSPKPYVQEHTDLVASIREGKPLNEARQVAESTLTAIMGRESAYTGKSIEWDAFMQSDLDLSPPRYEFGPLAVRPVPTPGQPRVTAW